MSLDAYRAHADERAAMGIPPLPLSAEQTGELCVSLENPPADQADALQSMLAERVAPGVDPAARVKADWLGAVAAGRVSSPVVDRAEAVRLLGTMLGGYNVAHLVAALDTDLADAAAAALAGLTMIFDDFDTVAVKAAAGHGPATRVLQAWADATWFTDLPPLSEVIAGTVYKVPGETNTDDLSPATHAPTRPDIPLHATAMYESRDPDCVPALQRARDAGRRVIMVGDVYGTGSSRKSATNSLLWWIGDDIPHVPNKRRGGVLLAGIIAPIFLNTMRDAGGLPIQLDVDRLNTGDEIEVDLVAGEVRHDGAVVSTFALSPNTLTDELRAGGRVPLIIGRSLTAKARAALGLPPSELFAVPPEPPASDAGYTLAQKLVGRACGKEGVRAGESCEPKMHTVGSQDTTGPMTADEMKELACLRFNADLVMQSFCHTAAYPKPVDVAMHGWLPEFITERGGVALRPGDGVIHSWLNRMIIPDGVGTGGDSHTRFPLGISFPAGSGLVAFAAALGFMPLDMPESVLVRFTGEAQPGITLRDLVNAIPLVARRAGELGDGRNVFAGRILEIEGLEHLTVEQAYEFTDASAERSAAAATFNLAEGQVADFLRSNVALLEGMIADGYQDADALRCRADAMRAWLAAPQLLRRDPDAQYARVFEIDLATITEPVVCCPNDPDAVATLSEVAGTPVDEVFVGSCMVNIGHFRALARVFEHGGAEYTATRTWVCPPTRMDAERLRSEGTYNIFGAKGCRVEIPGCSLCMGNQARVQPEGTVFSTSTRNFNNRMGRGANVYLGSAELAAAVAITGRLPTPEEYRDLHARCIAPHAHEIYTYQDFSRDPAAGCAGA